MQGSREMVMLELPRPDSLKEAAKLPREQVTASTLHKAGRERRRHLVRFGGRDYMTQAAWTAALAAPTQPRPECRDRLQFRKATGSGGTSARKLLPRSSPKAG